MQIITGAAAFALCAALMAGCEERDPAPSQVAAQSLAATLAPDKPTATPAPAQQETETPEDNASELWSDDSTLHHIKPLDITLDAETQQAIYEVCGYDPDLFCFVMAIAQQESRFCPDAQNGPNLGMMQINTRWHTGRVEALCVTDLTDPIQCTTVAVDYIRELVDRYGFEPESEALLMAYNMGPSGARKAMANGTTSTGYSREVMRTFQGYLEETEGEQ